MTGARKGVRLKVSPARRLVLELLHHARKVPSLPLAKTFDLADLAAARGEASSPPSWVAIFMRAYGLSAENHPELRRAFIRWPLPHFYEHPHSECAVLIEREHHTEQIVLGAKIRAPERLTLAAIDAELRHFKEAPLWEVNYFRQLLRIARLPALIRRFLFWHSLDWSGYKRAKRFGTFMISSLGSQGVEQFHPLTPLTTYLTFGPVSPAGAVTVKIIYDHRVMDGRAVARCLNDLEQVLRGPMLAELRGLRRAAA
jgi:hypothetical protein